MAARAFVAGVLVAIVGVAAATGRRATSASPAASATTAGSAAPGGFIPFDDYDPKCGFYVPRNKSFLPRRIEWQPCAAGVALPGVECRQMVLDFPSVGGAARLQARTMASVAPDGTVTLAVSRFSGVINRVVADADGPVRQAILESRGGEGCTLGQASLGSGNIVYRVYDSEARGTLSAEGGGALGGPVDERPRVLRRFHDHVSRELVAARSSFIENTLAFARSYSFQNPDRPQPLPRSPGDGGLVSARFRASGDDVFWSASGGGVARVDSYGNGRTRALIAPEDGATSADDFGTDGVDMVWSQATRPSPDGPPSVAIFTSPATTDPARLAPRRLRSEYPGAYQVSPFVVGCGYAAHYVDPADGRVGIRVLRLSDARSWTLFTKIGPGAHAVLQQPLAVTCDEMFAQALVDKDLQVIRVRLASLGNGEL